jgi:formylglycine-generating enzyme required for sulfatase activity
MPESPLPETVTLRLDGAVSLTLQRIDPGIFRMGARGEYTDEEPVHRVEITRVFYLGITPVTQAQFGAWTQACGIEHENGFPDRPDHPAENMDWFSAVAYCRWLQELCASAIPSGYRVGLPTEAEWEYACRGGPWSTQTEYWSGDGEAALDAVGWWDGNSGGTTHPVGAFGAAGRNPCGLWDMHGNVWEWCDDGWDANAYRCRIDGVRAPWTAVSRVDWKTDSRVVRGGSWDDSAGGCRSAFRGGRRPDDRNGSQGLRVCLFSGPIRNSDGEPATEDGVRRQAETESYGAGETSGLEELQLPPRSGEIFE